MDNVRILRGYSKGEQNELKEFKKTLDITDLLHIITGLAPDTGCGLIWRRYDKADTYERISIIRDILDFYTDKANFAEPKKYYVHLIKSDEHSYIRTDVRGEVYLDTNFEYGIWKTKFTRDKVVAMNPKLLLFMEEVEDY